MSDNAKKDVAITFRCDPDLADQFKRVAKSNGYSYSLILRELMKEYLAKNKQPDLLK